MVDKKELKNYKKSVAGTGFASQNSPSGGAYSNQGFGQPKAEEVKKTITICIGESCNPATLDKISKIVAQAGKGKCKIYLTTGKDGQKLETPHRIDYDEKIIDEISNVVGAKNVILESA